MLAPLPFFPTLKKCNRPRFSSVSPPLIGEKKAGESGGVENEHKKKYPLTMRNPIKWFKGRSTPFKRYYFVSVLLSTAFYFDQEMLSTETWLAKVIFAPITILLLSFFAMYLLLVVSYVVHSLIHILEGESD